MPKIKSQNEADNHFPEEDTGGFWLATGLIIIMIVVIIGFMWKML